ncbi:MAG TPA: hypothetical protein VMC06_11695 [Opitutaceae bacterium]|nr:hypothetical protein [Opitutaceae bacterium]
MTTRFPLFILAAALAVAGTTACHFIRSKAPKESPNITSDVEAGFKQRWIDKRAAELTATGTDTTAARQQAEKEFNVTYSYLRSAEPARH